MKKFAEVLLYFGFDCGMLKFSLSSHNPKNICPSRIFGAQFGEKDRGLSTCKP
jgi:hypothetical protein